MLNLLIDFVNFLINGIVTLLNAILLILPNSPFKSVDFSFITPYLGYINWLFPVRQCLVFLSAWLGAILIYYAYTIVLRVTQSID